MRHGDKWDVIVVGGGPAGFTAGIFAARRGLSVLLLEKKRDPLRKLRITGKGRCNLANSCDMQSFLKNVVSNPRFLYGAVTVTGSAVTALSRKSERDVPVLSRASMTLLRMPLEAALTAET